MTAPDMTRPMENFLAGSGYSGPDGVPVDCQCSMPTELAAGAVHRVQIAALGFGAVWLVVLVMNNLARPLLESSSLPGVRDGWPWPGNFFVSAGLVLSLAMAWFAHRWSRRSQLVLDVGLVFLILSAAIVGVMNFWGTQVHGGRISWITAMILAYPSIAPNTPTKTLVAGLLAASMDFVGMGIGSLRGIVYGLTGFELLWLMVPNYICAFLAVIPAKILRTLGQQVTEARELGSYRLVRLLGKGGMGEVHAATHRMIARPAAVKFVRPELLGSTSRNFAGIVAERFRREAEAAASLRSPHTIQLYDFGVVGGCTPYYVMELLDGIDAQRLVEQFGPLPPERVVHLLRQMCDSLAEAHSKGLVHRDIKPSNIHVCRMGLMTDWVKVLDFGLVKRESPPGSQDVELTAAGDRTTGTPAYMAPEVATGDQPADRRTDLYAVGCVGYWLLTGRTVFEAPGVIPMMYKHAHEAPSAPSAFAPSPLPLELDALVLACLAKDPNERPGDAQTLSALLDDVPLDRAWTQHLSQEWWGVHLAGPSPSLVSP